VLRRPLELGMTLHILCTGAPEVPAEEETFYED
jgi:hypothetical protein